MLAAWARDIRYAFRSLTRQPATSAVAVLSLGLGVGVATTAFTLLNAMALRSLPGIRSQDRVVMLGVSQEDASGRRLRTLLSVPDVETLASHDELFSGVTAAGPTEVAVAVDGEPAAMPAEITLANHFRVLGTRPALGRFFTEEEDRPGAVSVVVSHGFWQRSLGGRADVVGRSLRVNGRAFTVVGVAPEGFTGMTPGDVVSGPTGSPALWLPMGAADVALPPWAKAGARARASEWVRVAARLQDGVTPARLAAALPRVSAELERTSPDARKGARLVSGDLIFGPGAGRWRGTLTVLAFMVVPLLVLLIAAANAANLLLARTLARRRELAVRSALGASRGVVLRSVVAESVLLAAGGGILGLAVAIWSRQLAALFAVHLVAAAPLDLRVFGFVLAASASVGLLFGLVPALGAGQPAAGSMLSGASRSGETRGAARIRRGLVVAQVAISVILLVAAGLFVRSVGRGMAVDTGLAEDGLTLFTLDLDVLGYDAVRGRAFFRDLVDGVRSLPDVESAALADLPPLRGLPRTNVSDAGRGEMAGAPAVGVARVGEGWFEAAGLKVLSGDPAGAGHRWHEGVVAVNRTLAGRLWPDGPARGRMLRIGGGSHAAGGQARAVEVVAVTADARTRLHEPATPVLYLPMDSAYSPRATLYVRAAGHPGRVVPAVRDVVRRLDPALPLGTVETAAQLRRAELLPWRLLARAMAVLGAIALVLAAVGLYGVVSHAVARRTREIGVRMAVGATRFAVVGMVLRQGLGTVTLGLAIGGLAAAGVAELLGWMLFGVSPLDPVTYASIAGVLLAVSVVAVLGPARRAASVEPARTLKE